METTNKNTKKIVIGVVALVAIIAIFFGLYTKFRPQAQTGSKNVTIEVIDDEEKSTVYQVSTDAEYLKGAMEDAKGLEFFGEDGDYGFTLMTINGLTADFNVDNAYWSIMVNGEYGNYGVDGQVVTDGDTFQFIYTIME